MLHGVLALAGGEQRRLVHDVGEVGAREAGRARRDDLQIDLRAPAARGARAPAGSPRGPGRPGWSTTTWRSKRPARRSAGSRTSGRFVAAMMITPLEESKPSISTRSWFSVCSRSSCPPTKPRRARAALPDGVQLVDEDDAGRLLLRLLEEVPHPGRAHADEHLDELRAATARRTARRPRRPPRGRAASCRVPGGPTSSTPFGMRPPSRWYFCGFLRKSTTSTSSAFASSTPATSAKVVLSSLRS